jgi:hypothetical protein
LVELYFLFEPVDDALFILLLVDTSVEILELVVLGHSSVRFQPIGVSQSV